jgi:phage shock protein A
MSSIAHRIAALSRIKANKAQDKTEQSQVRAGALEDATLPAGRDDIQAELERVTADSDVDKELARMKEQFPASAAPPAVEGGGTRQTPPDQEETS